MADELPWDNPAAGKHAPPRGHVGSVAAEIGNTMTTYGVYFVLSMSSHLVKIGYAKDPWKRLSSMQTGCPEELRMMAVIYTYLPVGLESDLHVRFAAQRVRGEWFSLTDELVDYAIQWGREDWEDAA